MLHLTCVTSFLQLFVFLVSSIHHHHHPPLLHPRALILGRLLTFLMASFGYSALLPLAQDHCLELCHDVSSGSVDYTYAHVSLNQKSLIDHVFVHKDCKRLISNYVIVEDGTNMSDHLPICFQLQWSVQSGVVNVNKNMNVVVEHRWEINVKN